MVKTLPLRALVTVLAVAVTTAVSPFGQAPASAASVNDSFSRTSSSSWGVATSGATWATTGATGFAVNGAGGVLPVQRSAEAYAQISPAMTDVSVSTSIAFQAVPKGATAYVGTLLRSTPGAGFLLPRLAVGVDGSARLNLRHSPSRGVWEALGADAVLPFQVGPGTKVMLRAEAVGNAPTTLRARAWLAGTPEPTTWQVSATSAGVPARGSSGYFTYTGSAGVSSQVVVDNFTVTDLAIAPQSPTASFTATVQGSGVSVDATGSTDPDGVIQAYSWNFGDGGTATGRVATHSYAKAGTYQVTLVVTDDQGRTASTTRSVTVAGASSAPSGRPNASNTGVPDGTSLYPIDNNLIITTPGTVIDGADIRGFVHVRAPSVTIRRSYIRGGVTTFDQALVNVTTPGASLVLEDSTLIPQNPSYHIDGVRGSNFVVRRVEIAGTVDGVFIYGPPSDINSGGNVRVERSWLHGFRFYANDPRQSDGSHNDAVQVLGGKNITIAGNTLEEAHNAAVQVTQTHNVVANLTIDGNWANGGGCSLNINRVPRGYMSGLALTNNRFGRATRNANCPITVSAGQAFTFLGNVWDDTSQPVTFRTG